MSGIQLLPHIVPVILDVGPACPIGLDLRIFQRLLLTILDVDIDIPDFILGRLLPGRRLFPDEESRQEKQQDGASDGQQEHSLFLSVHFHIFLSQKVIAFDGVEDEDDEAESHENPYADGHDTLVPVLDPIPYSIYDLHISSSSGFPSARS